MEQNGPIIDHTADGAPSTSTLRDSDAAEAGGVPALNNKSAKTDTTLLIRL
jgi:hypothetical protein